MKELLDLLINSGFIFYVLDTETTGLDPDRNDVIELSIFRVNDQVKKTWCLKPLALENIEADALRINGHKIEDLKHETKYGKDTYLDPAKVIVEVENLMMEDGSTSEDRILVGQNGIFDKIFLEKLWKKCNSSGTFPFGRKALDTIQMTLIMDLVTGKKRERYNLTSLAKDFGVKLDKAHRAEDDTLATKDLWLKLMEIYKIALNK